jgi:hypothetical protein
LGNGASTESKKPENNTIRFDCTSNFIKFLDHPRTSFQQALQISVLWMYLPEIR